MNIKDSAEWQAERRPVRLLCKDDSTIFLTPYTYRLAYYKIIYLAYKYKSIHYFSLLSRITRMEKFEKSAAHWDQCVTGHIINNHEQ